MRLKQNFWSIMFLCINFVVSGCLPVPGGEAIVSQNPGAGTETGQSQISKTNSSSEPIENTYPNPGDNLAPTGLPSPPAEGEANKPGNVYPAARGNDRGEVMKEIHELEPSMQRIVETAMDDLAGRMDADCAEIGFAGLEFITWPDGSMGCPAPGMRYKQVQVDGYRVTLVLDGVEYAYHGGGNRAPFLCERGAFPSDMDLSPPGNPDV